MGQNVPPFHPLRLGDAVSRTVSYDESMRWLGPGACLIGGFLTLDEQVALAARCGDLADADTGAYVPTVRGGGRMRVRMLCLGRHWNPRTYTYEAIRSDFDGKPVPALPPDLAAVACRAAAAAGFAFAPDICLINCYDDLGRMGLHQDKDESRPAIDAGIPIVSLSIGDTARFLLGGLRRRDSVEPLPLHSGDAFLLGGPARLRYHGVSRILPGTAPPALAGRGRLNLTFRQYGV
jgi:DNA alkylation damage repair protein AlkB